jgi:hypothetical protein
MVGEEVVVAWGKFSRRSTRRRAIFAPQIDMTFTVETFLAFFFERGTGLFTYTEAIFLRSQDLT